MSGTTNRNQRRNEIAFKILVAILKDGHQALSVFGSSSGFASQAVSSELKRLFEGTQTSEKLIQMIAVKPAEITSFAQSLFAEAGLPSKKTPSSRK